MHRLPVSVIAAATAALLLAGAPVHAQQRGQGQPRERDDALARNVRSVERNTGSRVVSAEPVPYGDGVLHRIKTVDDQGRVRTYMMNEPRDRQDEDRNDDRREPARDRFDAEQALDDGDPGDP